MTRPFRLVDVFGSEPFTGNPLAVVAAADDLMTDEMQRITRWLNLSETAFLLVPTDPDADYRVRIFTLARELPFAGHPTLGSCHAWLEAGGRPRRDGVVVQECGAGLVTLRRDGGTATEEEIAEVVEVLRLERGAVVDCRWIDNGPGWIGVLLQSAEKVLALEPARHHHRRIDVGIVGPYPPGASGDAAFEVRAIFSDAHGALIEDPVTGSLNASVGQWLFETGRATERYVATQGACLGRNGKVEVSQDRHGQVWVGGRTRTLFVGRGRD